MGEALFGLLILCAVVPLSARRPGLGAFVLSALFFGLALYVRPTALFIAPLVLGVRAYMLVRSRPLARGTAMLGAAGLAVVLSLAVVSPWIARNREHVHGAVIATNSGANLLVGTIAPYFVPLPKDQECPYGMRELARDRCRRDVALRRIAADPVGWAALAPLKLAHTFGHEVSCAYQLGLSLRLQNPMWHPLVWTLAALASFYWLAVLFFAIRGFRLGRRSIALVLVAPAIGVAALHAVSLGGDRYHQPLVPLFAVLAAPALVRLFSSKFRSD
jgi:hypothetical protein